jgi:isocitrate dehydrogenase
VAQKAEEYGSHDKTFEIPADGTVSVINSGGEALMTHDVSTGDVWRMCQTKDEPIKGMFML